MTRLVEKASYAARLLADRLSDDPGRGGPKCRCRPDDGREGSACQERGLVSWLSYLE